jgi:uncharacterized protein (DUF305 family)
MSGLSFIAMYILMYMMVDVLGNVIPSVNQFYMAGAMTAAMILIEVLVMGSMYESGRTKTLVLASSTVLLALFIFLTRTQIGITERDFLRSMIPHHAGAILMCKNGNLQDPQIIELCQGITSGQQREIDFMKEKLDVGR